MPFPTHSLVESDLSKNHEPRDFGCSSIRLLAPIGYYYEPKQNSERGGTESMESSQGRKRVYHEGRGNSPVCLCMQGGFGEPSSSCPRARTARVQA